MRGVAPGELVLDGAETPALPLEPCDRLHGECTEERCDAESSVSAVTLETGTRRGSFGIATDHVLADRVEGACFVHGHAIGPDPGSAPLDAGFDWALLPGGERDPGRIDQFAISCELAFSLDSVRLQMV